MTKNKIRGKIDDLAQQYLDNKISFNEALTKSINVARDNSAFQRLLNILNEPENAPKTKGCKYDNSL